MSERKTLGRREFTAASAMAVLSGVAITLTACGGDSSSPTSPAAPTPSNPTPDPTPASSADKVGTVGSNHGHSAVITGAQLTAAGEVLLDITGNATHPHTVVLSAGEVQQIADGQRVSKESSFDASHSHTVTFN
jgi:hypothetical protein